MFGQRLGLLLGGFLVAAAVVVLRLWWLQFVAVDDIRDRALEYRKVEVALPAARGAIRDTTGKVLARDRAAFSVELIPSTYRERSLLNAIVDLEVMLGRGAGPGDGRRGPEGEPWRIAHLREDARDDPQGFVDRVLRLPAKTTSARVKLSARSLCAEKGGDLLRGQGELVFRLRQCLGVVQGRGLPFRQNDLSHVRDHGGSLGDALSVDADAVASRLVSEVRVIEEVGGALGFESAIDFWAKLDGFVQREISWVRSKRIRELRSRLCLERFGSPILDPERVEPAEYMKVGYEVAVPFADDAAHRARRALRGARALLGGKLPAPKDGCAVEELPAGDVRREDTDALERADAEGLTDFHPRQVEDAWFEKAKPGVNDEHEFISPRRDKEIRNRNRGGRSFSLGSGAPAGVAALVVGPGRLESIGFRLVPAFVRDDAIAEQLSPLIRQMVGTVTADSRNGAYGVEASMNEELRGTDGSATVNREGGVELKRAPEKATDATLSFSVDVIDALQKIVPPSVPFGLAVIDIRTGAVVGMATGPVPEDEEEARHRVAQREVERRELRRVLKMSADERAHALGYLRSLPSPTEAEKMRRTIIDGVLELGPAWIPKRQRQLIIDDAASAGWHRAYRIPHQSPPGSVFKAMTVLLGLREGVIDAQSTFDCVNTNRGSYHGCKNHGTALGVTRALAKSCNEYCYQVGVLVGTERLVAFYEELGLFRKIPGLPVLRPRRGRVAESDAKTLSIGMGNLDCTPVMAAGLAASIASGRVVRPWIAGGVPEPGPRLVPAGSEWILKLVHDGMAGVCSSEGTASEFSSDLQRLKVAAKTGTADHPGPDGNVVNEAWFVGFAPVDDPKLAFAVVLPNARSSSPGVDGVQGADGAPYAVKALEICAAAMGIRWW